MVWKLWYRLSLISERYFMLMPIKKILNIAFYALIFLNLFFLTAIIAFQITFHGETVKVPDLIGKTFEEGNSELSAKKLIIIQSGIQLHEKHEKGKIIFQDPPEGSRLKLLQEVKVIVSGGKEKVIVPRLRGRSFQMISTALEEFGLFKGRDSHVYTGQYSAGRIIAQSPIPEQDVPKGTRISFLVSEGERGKKYLMPDLIGKHESAVRAQLRAFGFRVADLRQTYYPGIDSGIIIKQFPKQGSPVQKRNLITLEVSK
ncbi:PASTA domain-containing protein [Acidobacteriota bacterium]